MVDGTNKITSGQANIHFQVARIKTENEENIKHSKLLNVMDQMNMF
jgi:hypothetical protein